MANIDREKNTINGKHYFSIYDCLEMPDDSINPDYLWVIKRDMGTVYSFKENIYCVKENKFLFEVWYDRVTRGTIHEGRCFFVEYNYRGENGKLKKRILNKASIHDGHLLDDWKDYKKFYDDIYNFVYAFKKNKKYDYGYKIGTELRYNIPEKEKYNFRWAYGKTVEVIGIQHMFDFENNCNPVNIYIVIDEMGERRQESLPKEYITVLQEGDGTTKHYYNPEKNYTKTTLDD